mmetsp:Transcript_16219/g.30272  ORF Transcript_16219/g.30272 Transcript_16219/m.30272 type:complete len:209 (+) Transcript_16219:105-731(+)
MWPDIPPSFLEHVGDSSLHIPPHGDHHDALHNHAHAGSAEVLSGTSQHSAAELTSFTQSSLLQHNMVKRVIDQLKLKMHPKIQTLLKQYPEFERDLQTRHMKRIVAAARNPSAMASLDGDVKKMNRDFAKDPDMLREMERAAKVSRANHNAGKARLPPPRAPAAQVMPPPLLALLAPTASRTASPAASSKVSPTFQCVRDRRQLACFL